ncbi:MAG: hypothetical protein JNM11_06910, partial [Chitinimonas sp.]|nr:hypothetical protein [Chitinimonas sp.]
MLENTHIIETQAAAAETLPIAHGWLARTFQQGDRFNAWLIGSQSQLSQQQLDEVDGLVRSPKAWLIGGVLSVLILVMAFLVCAFDSQMVLQRLPDDSWHISTKLIRQPLPFSFWPWVIGTWLLVFWAVLDVWYGYRKYLNGLRGYLKLAVWGTLLPMLLIILLGVFSVLLRAPASPLQSLAEMLQGLLLGLAALLVMGLGIGIAAILTVVVSHWRNKEIEE